MICVLHLLYRRLNQFWYFILVAGYRCLTWLRTTWTCTWSTTWATTLPRWRNTSSTAGGSGFSSTGTVSDSWTTLQMQTFHKVVRPDFRSGSWWLERILAFQNKDPLQRKGELWPQKSIKMRNSAKSYKPVHYTCFTGQIGLVISTNYPWKGAGNIS